MVKKSIWIFLIFISSYLCFWNVAYANNKAEVYLTSKQMEVDEGSDIEITVNIENSKIASCNFYIYFEEEKVEFVSEINQEGNSVNTNLQGNRLSFVWFDKLGGKGAKEGEVASFKFRAKENGLTSFIIEGEFYGENGQLIDTNFKGEQVQIGKEEKPSQNEIPKGEKIVLDTENTNLEILAIENALLYPSFDKAHTDYEVEVSNKLDSLNIFAVPENENATAIITGKDDLKEGSNLVTVVVKSESGVNEKTYNIRVNRRNQEEEKRYEEEQSKKKEELENAYKIEKVSKVIKESSEEISKKQDNNYVIIATIVALVLILPIAVVIYLNIRKKHKV